jgi:hypothetical protein
MARVGESVATESRAGGGWWPAPRLCPSWVRDARPRTSGDRLEGVGPAERVLGECQEEPILGRGRAAGERHDREVTEFLDPGHRLADVRSNEVRAAVEPIPHSFGIQRGRDGASRWLGSPWLARAWMESESQMWTV